MPVKRTRRLFERLGCQFNEWERTTWSKQIHAFLEEHLGATGANFNKAFDIPFLVIAQYPDLQEELFGETLVEEKEEEDA